MEIKEVVEILSNSSGVSGYEEETAEETKKLFEEFCDKVEIDSNYNVIGIKKGTIGKRKILLMAHIDEIGLMVNSIDKESLLTITNLGGFDPRTLLYQDIKLHGKKKIDGVIVPKKDYDLKKDRQKAIGLTDLRVDIGLKEDKSLKELFEIGDVITIDRSMLKLKGNYVSGKAMDDRACVASLIECGRELKNINHEFDIYFVGSVQEEVGTRGAYTTAYKIDPDLAIAVDVTFGGTFDIPNEDTVEMGKGSGLTIGGNIHSGLRNYVTKIANEYNYPYQVEVTPGQTGTDARAIQLTKAGIPTVLLAVPLRYMHTSIEIIKTDDVVSTGRLISKIISKLEDKSLEEIICY